MRLNSIGRPRLFAPGVLAFGLLATGTAIADFKDDYVLGLKAVKDGNWGEAETRMRAAFAARPEAVERLKLYGMRIEAYVPQYYLGQAALQRGDCASAISYWTADGARQVIESVAELRAQVADGLTTCRPRLADAQPPVNSNGGGGQRSAASARVLDTPLPSSSGSTPNASIQPRPIGTTSESQQPSSVARQSQVVASAATTTQARGNAPAALAAIVDAYHQGRLSDVISIDPLQFDDERARYHALLLHAASLHTDYLSNETVDANRLATIVAEIRRAKLLQPNQTPDPLSFSPRFRQLYAVTN